MSRAERRQVITGFLAAAPVPLAMLVALVVGLASLGGVAATQRTGPATATAAERKEPRGRKTITLAWAGDITPGSQYGTLPGDGRSLYAGVRDRLAGHDVTMGNLEGTLGDQGAPKCGLGVPNCFSFRAPAEAAEGLRWAGFDVLNVANNHSMDYGPEAQVATVAALSAAKLRAAGLPGRVQVLRRHGVRIAVVSFSTYRWTSSLLDPAQVQELVGRAAAQADVVVVLMHGGAEGSDRSITPPGPETYLGEQRGDLRAFARQAVDAGADLVLGSGPHVLRGMEVYRDRLIAYSLGNFAGVKNFSTAGDLRLSALLSMRVTRDGLFTGGYLHPLVLDASGRPSVDPGEAATSFVRTASERDFPGTAARVRESGKLLPPASPFATG